MFGDLKTRTAGAKIIELIKEAAAGASKIVHPQRYLWRHQMLYACAAKMVIDAGWAMTMQRFSKGRG